MDSLVDDFARNYVGACATAAKCVERCASTGAVDAMRALLRILPRRAVEFQPAGASEEAAARDPQAAWPVLIMSARGGDLQDLVEAHASVAKLASRQAEALLVAYTTRMVHRRRPAPTSCIHPTDAQSIMDAADKSRDAPHDESAPHWPRSMRYLRYMSPAAPAPPAAPPAAPKPPPAIKQIVLRPSTAARMFINA